MAEAHLICGGVGAGKTTYARALAMRLQAPRFSIDEWMRDLYLADAPSPFSYEWALERTLRCERQILSVCAQRPDLAAVLDFGFLEASHRERIRAACREIGLTPRLHYLDVDAETRWSRVGQRNAQRHETFVIQVTRQMFDFCETLFEAPGPEELRGATVVQ